MINLKANLINLHIVFSALDGFFPNDMQKHSTTFILRTIFIVVCLK